VKLARNLPMMVAVASVFFLAANAQAQNAGSLVDRFERTYRSSRTLQARFLERYLENGKEVRSEAGIAYFARPGRMRWEYQSPEPNLFVIDGKWSWFYVPSDHTVTRVRAKESSDWRTPLALLAGEMRVSRICARVRLDAASEPLDPGNAVLRCELRESDQQASSRAPSPGAKTESQSVLFELNAATGELRRILVSDPGGVQVEFRFADWLFNPPLDAAMFHFAPPKGVAVVDGDLAAAGSSGTLSGLSPLGVN
jgi:outer membrane lipoprotein carrier protein